MLGRDISHLVPPAGGTPGIVAMPDRDQELWERAVGHLHVRDNDAHTTNPMRFPFIWTSNNYRRAVIFDTRG